MSDRKDNDSECTCAPCHQCGYGGNDSDDADCYGEAPSVEKAGLPGVRFFGPHCRCWHASPGDCFVHGSEYPTEEAIEGLEPCLAAGEAIRNNQDSEVNRDA